MKKEVINTYIDLLDEFISEDKCFVFGAGTSLFDLYNCDEKYIEEIKKHLIIFVNSAIIIGKDIFGLFPDDKEKRIFISNDALCRNWSWWEEVQKSNYIKIVRNSWYKYRDELPGFLYFSPRNSSEDVINPEDKDGLCYCCSVASAIDLALQFNIKKVFILGLDHYSLNSGIKHHFWQLLPLGGNVKQIKPAQGSYRKQSSVFPIANQSYRALQGFADYKSAKIYNCNPKSKVEAFEKIKLSEILKK